MLVNHRFFVITLSIIFVPCPSNGEKGKLSPNIASLFHGALGDCTIRVVLKSHNDLIERMYIGLASEKSKFSGHYYHTFIQDKFLYHQNIPNNSAWWNAVHTKMGDIGHFWVAKNYTSPLWLTNRHSQCYAHLYYVQSETDIEEMVYYHFTDFVLRKENPKFVLICEVIIQHSTISWDYVAEWHEFYNFFMDYRIFIQTEVNGSTSNISLMCAFCGTPEKLTELLTPLTSYSLQDIHYQWKSVHSHHLKHIHHVECFQCTYESDQTFGFKQPMEAEFGKLFNMSSDNPWDELSFGSHGWLSDSTFARDDDNYGQYIDIVEYAHEMFLQARAPAYTMLPAYMIVYQVQFVTVVHMSLFSRIGWKAIFVPFQSDVWILLLSWLVLLWLLIRKLAADEEPSTTTLAIFAMLTDQWVDTVRAKHVQLILVLWSFLIMSLTILYGGDMALRML